MLFSVLSNSLPVDTQLSNSLKISRNPVTVNLVNWRKENTTMSLFFNRCFVTPPIWILMIGSLFGNNHWRNREIQTKFGPHTPVICNSILPCTNLVLKRGIKTSYISQSPWFQSAQIHELTTSSQTKQRRHSNQLKIPLNTLFCPLENHSENTHRAYNQISNGGTSIHKQGDTVN